MSAIPDVGSMFAGYRLDEKVGAGNMGVVFKAWNPTLHRHEALKVLTTPEPPDVAERMRVLFRNEVRIAASLRAPNIISVFDGGEVDGLPWYTMTYVAGESLGEELSSYPPKVYGVHEVIAIVHDLAQALDALAEMTPPVVHGDVKPSNIMVERASGTFRSAMLVDFGVATVAEVGSAGADGRVAGSLPYMAPEILRSGSISAAGDQYALACTAHELLSGAKAFPAADVAEARKRHGERPPATGFGQSVDAVMHRALASTPDDRWPSCSAFANELGAALIGAETKRRKLRRRRVAATVTSISAVLAAGAVLWSVSAPDPVAVPFAEGSSAEFATLPEWSPDNPGSIDVGNRWERIQGSAARFPEMSRQSELDNLYRLGDTGPLSRLPGDAELFVYRKNADEIVSVPESETQIRDRLLAPLDPDVTVDQDIVKLYVPATETRLQILQSSGEIRAAGGGEFCLARPFTSGREGRSAERAWFVVLSSRDSCRLVYDAVGEWIVSGA